MSTRNNRRRGHHARDTLLELALGTLAVIAALAWLAEHLAVLAGCALLIAGAYYLGQRKRARPRQVHTAGTAAAVPRPRPRHRWPTTGRTSGQLARQAGTGMLEFILLRVTRRLHLPRARCRASYREGPTETRCSQRR